MAWHRIQHAKVRIRELEDSKTKYIQAAVRHQNRTNGAVTAPSASTTGEPTSGPGTSGSGTGGVANNANTATTAP